MEKYYQTDLNKAYLIISGEEYPAEDYQMQIIRDNPIPGLVEMEVRFVDNVQKYYYDVSGKTSLQQVFERKKPGYEEIKKLLESLLCLIYTLKKYMLSSDCILLDESTIFYDREKPFFCYCPTENVNLSERFHILTEMLVREVDYRDEKGVHLAYVMHKATMEDNYSLEQIMNEFLHGEEEETEQPPVSYESTVPKQEESIVEEKKNRWDPVKRFIEKTRMRL